MGVVGCARHISRYVWREAVSGGMRGSTPSTVFLGHPKDTILTVCEGLERASGAGAATRARTARLSVVSRMPGTLLKHDAITLQ